MGHSFPVTHILLWAVLTDTLHSSRGACYRRSPKDIPEQSKQNRLHTEYPHFCLTINPLSVPTGDGVWNPLESLGGSIHTYQRFLACEMREIHVALPGALVHQSSVQYRTVSYITLDAARMIPFCYYIFPDDKRFVNSYKTQGETLIAVDYAEHFIGAKSSSNPLVSLYTRKVDAIVAFVPPTSSVCVEELKDLRGGIVRIARFLRPAMSYG